MDGPIRSAAEQLISARSEERVFEAAVEGLDRLVDAGQCVVALEDDGRLVSEASLDAGLVETPAGLPISDTKGIIAHAIDIDTACIVDDFIDVRSVAAGSGAGEAPRYHSLLCVPFDGRGALIAADRDRGAFSGDDLEAVERLTGLVATALAEVRDDEVVGHDLTDEAAAILSHDVANAMQVANGHLAMAREDRESENLRKVASSLDRFQALVDDVVRLLRTGDRVQDEEELDLESVAERAWTAVDSDGADLDVVESMTFLGDETSVSQLLENLFRNAVEHGVSDEHGSTSPPSQAREDAGEHGGDAVTVQVGPLPDGDGFFVTDDGDGIPEDVRSDVFEYGVSSTADQTGFGLSIVRWIAEAHGWEVECCPESDDGARFEISDVRTPQRSTVE